MKVTFINLDQAASNPVMENGSTGWEMGRENYFPLFLKGFHKDYRLFSFRFS